VSNNDYISDLTGLKGLKLRQLTKTNMNTYRIESFIDARPIKSELVKSSNIASAVGLGARITKKAAKGKRIHQLVVRVTKI
jgi:hypothetical protein